MQPLAPSAPSLSGLPEDLCRGKQKKRTKQASTNNPVEDSRPGNSLKEWMDSGTVPPGFLGVVSPRSIPSRASAEDSAQWKVYTGPFNSARKTHGGQFALRTHPLTRRCTSRSGCGSACCLWCLLWKQQGTCERDFPFLASFFFLT